MRVAIILDQGAPVLVAGQLNGIWVDGLDWCEESLTVVDNHGFFVVVGGSSELWVNAWVNVGVATDHGEVDTVSALWLWVVRLWLVGLWVVGLDVVGLWLVMAVVDLRLVLLVVAVVDVAVVVMSVRVDIVVRVAIIRDQCAASVVAGELNLRGVDLVDRGRDGLSIDLDHCVVR